MKTLDEVIKAWGICDETVTANCSGCPYDIDCENVPREDLKADALHYLWEYRTEQQTLSDRKEHYEYWEHKYYAELEKNDPLDWETLKTMEGKPVWVEWYDHKEWFLIDAIDDNEVVFRAQNGFGWNCQNGNATWQAYRKERSE